MSLQPLDTEIGDDYKPVYASFSQRLGASLLDSIIVGVPITFLTFYGLLEGNFNIVILSFALLTIYKVLMEGTLGATIGKLLVRLRMVDYYGNIIDLNKSVLKNMPYMIQNSLSIFSFQYISKKIEFEEGDNLLAVLPTLETVQNNPYDMGSQFISFLLLVSCTSIIFNPLTKQTIHDRLANVYCEYLG